MEDLNKLSFSIGGDTLKATTAIDTLIVSVRQLGSIFDEVVVSGKTFSASLKEVANSVKASTATIKNAKQQLSGMTTANNTMKNSNKASSSAIKSSTNALRQMSSSFKTIKNNTTNSTKAINKSTLALKKNATASSINTFANKNNSLSLSSLIRKMSQITFVVYTLRKALNAISEGTQKAIAYVENLNLFMVALGKNTTKASAFITEMSTSMYLDEAQLTRVQGLFYQISESLGLTSEKAYTLSENFTKLAYDLASFYNISVDDAVTKLQAGLVGETEPLRRLGIIITENNLAETARNLGIKKSIRNMTEQEKIQLRYITTLQQTKNAQGDLARTIEQPENLLRIMHEQFSKLARELGNAFIPMVKKVVPEVISLTIALTKMAKAFALTAGYKPPVISDDMGGYQKVVENVAKEDKKTSTTTAKIASNIYSALKYTRALSSATTGIDELNIMDTSTPTNVTSFSTMYPTATGISAVNTAINEALGSYNNNMKEVDGLFTQLVDKWETRIATLKDSFSSIFNSSILAFSKLYKQIFGSTGELTTLDKIHSALLVINEVITGILNGLSDIVGAFQLLWTNGVKPILDAIAPTWLSSIEDGSLASKVEYLTLLFLGWKAIKFGAGFTAGIKGTIGALGGSFGLAGLVGMLGAIKLGIDVSKAIDTGELSKVGNEMKNAIATGLGVGLLTANPVLGVLSFGIVAILDLDLGKTWNSMLSSAVLKVEDAVEKIKKAFGINVEDKKPAIESFDKITIPFTVGGKSETTDQPVDKWATLKAIGGAFNRLGNGIASLATGGLLGKPIGAYANGGTPKKGSLFIAGEAGAELVGDLGNGGTSVINKKQMQKMGIPKFAKGVNVPAWTIKEQEASKYTKASDTSSFTITKQINSITDVIEDGFVKVFKFIKIDYAKSGLTSAYKKTSTFLVDTFKSLKLKASVVWKGITDSNAYKALSKSFGVLSKGVGLATKVYTSSLKGIGKVTLALFESYKSTDVQAIMSDTPSNGGSTIQQQSIMGDLVSSMLSGTPMGLIIDTMQGITSGMIGSFIKSLPQFIQSGVDMILSLVDGVVKALPVILEMIPKVITQIVGILTNKDTLNSFINGVLEIVVQLALALPDIMLTLIDAIPTVIGSLVGALISHAGDFVKVGVIIGASLVQGLVNIVIKGVNGLIKLINRVPFVNIHLIPEVDFVTGLSKSMGYANGGYPTQGQMFIAGEAGAELIGNIGGRTSVMNNDQIVEAVSNGVYEAVSRAMANTPTKDTVINLDGKRVSTGLAVSKRSTGISYGTGGF